MIPILRSLVADAVEVAVAPFGFGVYVTATHGRPGIDAWHVVRRPPGAPPAARLAG